MVDKKRLIKGVTLNGSFVYVSLDDDSGLDEAALFDMGFTPTTISYMTETYVSGKEGREEVESILEKIKNGEFGKKHVRALNSSAKNRRLSLNNFKDEAKYNRKYAANW